MKDYFIGIPFEGLLGISVSANNREEIREKVLGLLDVVRLYVQHSGDGFIDIHDVEYRIESSYIEDE